MSAPDGRLEGAGEALLYISLVSGVVALLPTNGGADGSWLRRRARDAAFVGVTAWFAFVALGAVALDFYTDACVHAGPGACDPERLRAVFYDEQGALVYAAYAIAAYVVALSAPGRATVNLVALSALAGALSATGALPARTRAGVSLALAIVVTLAYGRLVLTATDGNVWVRVAPAPSSTRTTRRGAAPPAATTTTSPPGDATGRDRDTGSGRRAAACLCGGLAVNGAAWVAAHNASGHGWPALLHGFVAHTDVWQAWVPGAIVGVVVAVFWQWRAREWRRAEARQVAEQTPFFA